MTHCTLLIISPTWVLLLRHHHFYSLSRTRTKLLNLSRFSYALRNLHLPHAPSLSIQINRHTIHLLPELPHSLQVRGVYLKAACLIFYTYATSHFLGHFPRALSVRETPRFKKFTATRIAAPEAGLRGEKGYKRPIRLPPRTPSSSSSIILRARDLPPPPSPPPAGGGQPLLRQLLWLRHLQVEAHAIRFFQMEVDYDSTKYLALELWMNRFHLRYVTCSCILNELTSPTEGSAFEGVFLVAAVKVLDR